MLYVLYNLTSQCVQWSSDKCNNLKSTLSLYRPFCEFPHARMGTFLNALAKKSQTSVFQPNSSQLGENERIFSFSFSGAVQCVASISLHGLKHPLTKVIQKCESVLLSYTFVIPPQKKVGSVLIRWPPTSNRRRIGRSAPKTISFTLER